MDPMQGVFRGLDIAAGGLSAEMLRAEVVAANIANMNITRGADGQPYRRRGVVFEEVLADVGGPDRGGPDRGIGGVRVADTFQDFETPFVPRFMPGHPHADERGWVMTSNVDLFREMVDMMAIVRSYQSNLAAMRSYRGMIRNTITHIGRS